MPQHLAACVNNLPPVFLHQPRRRKEFFVILVRHKTNLLALLLLRRLEIHAPGNLARLAFLQFTKRKHHVRQLLLAKREQKVRLVLPRIPATKQHCAAVALLEPSVMPGRHVLRAKLPGAVDQVAELQLLVAHHARVRRPPRLVLRREIIDHVPLKLLRFIDEIIRDVEFVGDRAGIHHRLRATALVLGAGHAILRPDLQRNADDVVPLLDQQRGGRGGVHPAAQADDDARFVIVSHQWPAWASATITWRSCRFRGRN